MYVILLWLSDCFVKHGQETPSLISMTLLVHTGSCSTALHAQHFQYHSFFDQHTHMSLDKRDNVSDSLYFFSFLFQLSGCEDSYILMSSDFSSLYYSTFPTRQSKTISPKESIDIHITLLSILSIWKHKY